MRPKLDPNCFKRFSQHFNKKLTYNFLGAFLGALFRGWKSDLQTNSKTSFLGTCSHMLPFEKPNAFFFWVSDRVASIACIFPIKLGRAHYSEWHKPSFESGESLNNSFFCASFENSVPPLNRHNFDHHQFARRGRFPRAQDFQNLCCLASS